jgi:hypothetical protein
LLQRRNSDRVSPTLGNGWGNDQADFLRIFRLGSLLEERTLIVPFAQQQREYQKRVSTMPPIKRAK